MDTGGTRQRGLRGGTEGEESEKVERGNGGRGMEENRGRRRDGTGGEKQEKGREMGGGSRGGTHWAVIV